MSENEKGYEPSEEDAEAHMTEKERAQSQSRMEVHEFRDTGVSNVTEHKEKQRKLEMMILEFKINIVNYFEFAKFMATNPNAKFPSLDGLDYPEHIEYIFDFNVDPILAEYLNSNPEKQNQIIAEAFDGVDGVTISDGRKGGWGNMSHYELGEYGKHSLVLGSGRTQEHWSVSIRKSMV